MAAVTAAVRGGGNGGAPGNIGCCVAFCCPGQHREQRGGRGHGAAELPTARGRGTRRERERETETEREREREREEASAERGQWEESWEAGKGSLLPNCRLRGASRGVAKGRKRGAAGPSAARRIGNTREGYGCGRLPCTGGSGIKGDGRADSCVLLWAVGIQGRERGGAERSACTRQRDNLRAEKRV